MFRRASNAKNRRRGSSGAGTPTQLLGDQLALRVEPGRISPASRTVYGTTRYTDPLQSGTPRQMLGKYGLTLDGISERAALSAFSPPAGEFWATFWFKGSYTPSGSDGFIGQFQPSSSRKSWLAYVTSSGYLAAAQSVDGVAQASAVYETNVLDGNWHHAAIKFGASVPVIYLDGALVTTADTGSTSGDLNTNTIELEIGRYQQSTGTCLTGQLDDIRIVESLTAAEIAAIAAMKPGSQSGATTSTKPLIHYKCEDSVTSKTLRNSGTLGSVADATITTAAIATVRGTASPVYSFANSVGGSQAYVTNGSSDYLDSQITLNGATAFSVWRRLRYLSSGSIDVDGFLVNSTNDDAINLGRLAANELYCAWDQTDNYTAGVVVADGQVHTDSLSATVGGNYTLRAGGVTINSASATNFAAITNTKNFLIGVANNASITHFSHAEYYEYLIADRVLTDDELTWLETGGQAGTAIDFEGDANILLYTDFSDQTATTIRNHANPNLPLLKSGGELTMVPRSESVTTKDVDQADYAYRSALYVAANTTGTADFNAQLIPSSADFDISLDFNLFAVDATDTDQTILSQHTAATDGRLLLCIEKATMSIQLFVGAADGVTDIDIQSASNTVVAGKWHTARITRVGDVFTLYVDGVQQDTQTLASASIEATDTFLGQSGTLTTHDEFHGLISNIDFGNGSQYLTRPGETISGATLSNASYVDVVRGKPGTIQHTGIAPRDMVLTEPALVLNGTSEYVTLPDIMNLTGDEAVEFEAWVNVSLNNTYIIMSRRDTGADGWAWWLDAGRLNLLFTDGVNELEVRADQTIGGTGWTHVRTTYDGSRNVAGVKHYINGTEITSRTENDTLGATSVANPGSVYIGTQIAGTLSGKLAGSLSNVKATVSGTQVGNWSFTGNSGDFEPDLSGNGNDGALVGTVASMRAGTTNVGSGTCVKDGYAVGRWYDGTNDDWQRAAIVNGATRLCLSAWVSLESTASTRTIASEYDSTGNQRSWALQVNASRNILLVLSSDGTAFSTHTGSSVLPENQLCHISATIDDDGTVAITLDGVAETVTDSGTSASIAATTADFRIGALDIPAGFARWKGVLSQVLVHKDSTAVWSQSTTDSIMAAGKPSEMAAIVSDLGGTAWYFEDGSGSQGDSLQNLPALTHNGASEQRVIPVGPNAIIPATHGPGLLPPDHSLDLYCGEDDAPISQLLAGDLTDGDYAFGDGGPEGAALFRKGDANGEEIAVINPAATGAELTILQSWDSD